MITFVPTNKVNVSMKIETLLKSSKQFSLEKSILLNILFTQIKITEGFNEILKPFDLSSEQYNVLRILRGQQGNPINMCDIQERMLAKTSNTTRLVDKLLLKGLVTRRTCEENRRKIEIEITPKGLTVLDNLEELVINFENSWTQLMELSEQEHLNTLLEKYRNK